MNKLFKNIINFLITAVFLVSSIYYATRGIDYVTLKIAILSANFYIALSTIPIVMIAHWIRALRWKTILKPIYKAKSMTNLLSAVMIGYAANNVLPSGRAGELLRPFVYSKREGVSFSSLFATIIVERVLDLLFLMLLFGFSFLALSHKILKILPQDANPNSLITGVVLLVLLMLVSFYPPFFYFMLNMTIKRISEKIYNRILDLFEKFKKGVEIIKSPSAYFQLAIESAAIWLFYALPIYITFFAFPFQEQLHLGIFDALMLTIVSGVGVTIAPVPGAIGVFHALVSTAMVQLYGIPKETALAFATIVHAVSYLVNVFVGAGFFVRENIAGLNILEGLNSKISNQETN